MEKYWLIKDFVSDPAELAERLWRELPLIRHPDRPRYECWMNDFNMPYTYGKGPGARTYHSVEWHPIISLIRGKLRLEGIEMDSCFVNGYKDGHDHLGWHADDSPEMDDTRHIVSVSLGAEREIWVRPRGTKSETITKVSLPSGSAFIMGPGMQDTHDHRIPKSPDFNCGPRLSLTFRGLIQ